MKVEITDYASGKTVCLMIQVDMEYPLTSTDWTNDWAPDYFRVVASEDQRPVAARMSPSWARAWLEQSHQGEGVTFNPGNYWYDGPTEIHHLNFAIPEDVPYVLTVWESSRARPS